MWDRREESGGEVVSFSYGAFKIINANSSLSTDKPQIFYSNHTNELSIFHLCKIFAIVCREILNGRRTRFSSTERTWKFKARTPLERIHVSNVTFVCICGNYIYFPYLESRRDRENTVEFSKSTVTPWRFFHIPISLSFEILSGMRLHRSHDRKDAAGRKV